MLIEGKCDFCGEPATTVIQWLPGGKVERKCSLHGPVLHLTTGPTPAYLAQGSALTTTGADTTAKNAEIAHLGAALDFAWSENAALAGRVGALEGALRQALDQWRMYANDGRQFDTHTTDPVWIEAATDTEARVYQACAVVLVGKAEEARAVLAAGRAGEATDAPKA